MNTINGYANYGVLAHEKQVIFTVSAPHCHATVSDRVVITIPDDWEVAENNFGDVLIISPDGVSYLGDDIISSYGDKPVLSWFDGSEHRITLEFS